MDILVLAYLQKKEFSGSVRTLDAVLYFCLERWPTGKDEWQEKQCYRYTLTIIMMIMMIIFGKWIIYLNRPKNIHFSILNRRPEFNTWTRMFTFHLCFWKKYKFLFSSSVYVPIIGAAGFLTLVKQPVKEKEKTEFNPAYSN